MLRKSYNKNMALDNRLLKRVPVNCDVLINRSLKVRGLDLSEGGIYVHTGRIFKPGMTLDIVLELGGRYVGLKAVVQHAQEAVGMGLKFLNITPEQKNEILDFMESASFGKAAASAKKKILLVDDNETTRKMNMSRLILDGYAVVEATDGIGAIQAMQSEAFDLVVLDIQMEKMDGYKVLSVIRQTPSTEKIPVFILSAKSGPADVQKAVSAGATAFLPKMMTSPIKLAEKIKETLRK